MAILSLLRRTIEDTPLGDDGDYERMNPLAIIVIMLTFVVFIFLMFSVTYTYGHVIPTLCMIESPAAQAYIPVNSTASDAPPPYAGDEDDGTPKPNNADEEVLLVQNRPITSSIRATVLHLRTKAGYWSRFRGLSVFLVWNFVRSLLTNILAAPFGHLVHPMVFSVAAIIAETLLARLHLTWVQ